MQTSQLDAVRPAETQVAEAEESVQVFPIGSPRTEAIAASVREEASRPIATMGEAAGAAIQHWTTTNLLNAVRKPSFVPDDTFDVVGRLNLLPFAPSPDEERILRKTVSDEDFDYEVGRIQNLREAARVMGDRPVVAFAALATDPLHVVTDIASLRMASLLRARRLAAAAAAGTGTAALGAAEYATSPISSSEVILGAMLNSAAVGALHRTGRAVSKAEADLVSKEVGSLVAKSTDEIEVPVQRKVAGKGAIEETPAPKGNKDTLKGAEQVPKVLEETSTMTPPKINRKPVPEAVPIRQMVRDIVEAKPGTHSAPAVAALRKLEEKLGDALDHIQVVRKVPVKRSYYDPATDTIYLRRGVAPNMIAHEVAHAATAHKLRYGRLNPNTTHGKIVRELEDIRKTALKELGDDPNLTGDMAYYLGKTSSPEHALDEFVAGLFSGDKKFLEALSKIPDRNSPITGVPILRSLWDAVRRLLGLDRNEANLLERAMGLTDGLLDAPVPASRVDPTARFLFEPAAPTAPTSPQAITEAVNRQLDSLDKRIGAKVAWNLHKSASKFNQRVADILFSDPTNQSKSSASSVKRAIQADLKAVQFEAEGKFAEELARRGIRQWHYLWHKGEALQAQRELTREVSEIMAARENAQRLGATYRRNPDNPLEDIADAVQRFYDAALEAESRAGVFGAEGRTNMQGYFQRRWDAYTLADVDAKFGVLGDEAGKEALAEQVAKTIRTEGLSESEKIIMAKAILDRTRNRGEFADNLFRGHIGNEAVLEIEDMLRRYGLDEDGIQRVSGVLTGRVEEAGKASRFKSRMDIDMTANIVAPDGTVYRMTDLMETDLMRLMEVRADEASGAAALARMGVVTVGDVSNLRADFLRGARTRAEKEEAAYLFDNGMKVLMGQPVGEDMNRGMRLMAAATQMVGLAYSGLWQVTEYAKMMSRYGLLRVIRESVRELPGLTTVARDDPSTLNRVLARNSYQEIRLRPFLSRLEDNFDISRDDRFLQVAHHAKQWVPFINAMAYVHRHQARVAGNLILDTIEKAAKGDAKAKRALSKYGMDKGLLDEVSEALSKHGESVDAWPVDTWERLRDPLTRMIDDDVLRSKTGEIPAFAQFSQVGKFIFTFRSFVLGAHNKILAGTLTNEGAGSMALMLAYQLPLTMAATQAASILRGDGFISDEKEWAEKTFSQMGGLGLFADLSGVILGNKDQFGAPGMIAIDKGFRLANEIASGDIGGAVKAGISATPLLGITPGMNALHLIWE